MSQKKHKAASEVTVASMTEAGLLQQTVQKYWMPAAAVALVATGFILFRQYQAEAAEAAQLAQWDEYAAAVTNDGQTGFPTGDPVALRSAATRLAGEPVSAYLRLTELLARRQQGDWAGASKALAALKNEHADCAYLQQTVTLEDGTEVALLAQLEASIESGRSWEQSGSDVFSNPPVPDDAPRVRLETTAGDLVVGLYPNLAPDHTANFLRLVDEGAYVGTKFHRVGPDFMIQGGDPNTKQDDDKSTWGQGDAGEQLDPEPNGLLHFEGVLAAAKKPGETQSSGSQFYITTGTPHHLDGQHTVFGALLEGADVAEAIATAAIVDGSGDQQTGRPLEPVEILSTTRL